MSIRNSGWLDWTTHKPGIFAKTYTQPNTGLLGLALHSWVGSEAETADGIPNRFLSEEKEARPGSPTDVVPHHAVPPRAPSYHHGNVLQLDTFRCRLRAWQSERENAASRR